MDSKASGSCSCGGSCGSFMSNSEIVRFDRSTFLHNNCTCLGSGELGGKAHGLAFIHIITKDHFENYPIESFRVDIPRFVVITTSYFDDFMSKGNLYPLALSGESDEKIAYHFQRAELPVCLLGDLRTIVTKIHVPLAVRSSSLLEDSAEFPFAGVYITKMIPNNESAIETRFQKLTEAIKLVYASTFFKEARIYTQSTGNDITAEKMAVIIQEMAGSNHGKRFYPEISGVGRSYNYYPYGHAEPEDGVINLALGLGKYIVDGGNPWTYSPLYPSSPPPYNSMKDLLRNTQTRFWAVNLGAPPAYDPIQEAEYLAHLSLKEAEYDNIIRFVASTYDPGSDRLEIGVGSRGPRVITFSPILEAGVLPLNDVVRQVLALCEKQFEEKVEIEFAVTIDTSMKKLHHFALLQVRPLNLSNEYIDIDNIQPEIQNALLFSRNAVGNGRTTAIKDILYVDPVGFDFKHSTQIARDIEKMNASLRTENKPYLLIGFGRWGSSDPWLGIPVNWSMISGAKTIVEVELTSKYVDLSQGSHFFHNISNLKIPYICIRDGGPDFLDWKWIRKQQVIESTQFVRHVEINNPLHAMIDGRKRVGVVLK